MRTFKSLFMIVALASVVALGTQALFSDTDSIEDNVIATGTLELTLNRSAGKPWAIDNAYPGYVSDWEYMDIYNSGSLPFEAEASVYKTTGSDDLWNYVTIEMQTVGWDSDCNNGDGGERTIYSGLAKDFTTGGLPVSDSSYWHLASEDDDNGGPDNIQAGWSERVCQRVGVHVDADNSVQGTSVTFTEQIDAVQDND